ncbi:MAG: NADH-quinone oxidoreductase subunit NuoG [Steroidobacteraceae bacterium]
MSDEFVNIEVNGVPMKARKGEMIIRVTDANDVYVPRFCYHEKLRIAANCRMCLVEVEKAPKPLPACATPVAEGMKVFTKSPKAIAAQKAVMEFLLINHPLDCPICDQGGECELQDLAVGFGRDQARFDERKRVVRDKNLGPLVSTDMTRCIHCTRCVRFGQEIAGIPELGTTGRGENMQIGTFIEKSVDHELSGNIIDLCPVGALNSKPFRFRARGWEMTQHPLISPHDGVGSQLYGHVLRGRLMRVVPRPSEEINETWISDRDRYSYEGVYSDDRLNQPMARQADGSWRNISWESALELTAQALQKAPADSLGFLAHASNTLEEHYLLARIAAGLGSANIDYRLRQSDLRDQAGDALAPGLGVALADVDTLDALLVVGSNLRAELPLLAHRVRKAALRGGSIGFLNPARFDYLFPVAQYLVSPPAQQVADLAAVLAAALEGAAAPAAVAAAVAGAKPGDAHRQLAATLKQGEKRAIWLGALALRHPAYADLRALARALAAATGASLGELAEGANAAGASLAGVLPHRGVAGQARAQTGLSAQQMLGKPLHTYVLLGAEPWADALQGGAALEKASCVIAITPFASEEMKRVATVLLPAAAFAETSGTFVNLEGRWQSFAGAALPVGEARPAWKILRVLGNLLNLAGFEYQSSEGVRDELQGAVKAAAALNVASPHAVNGSAAAGDVVDVPMYQLDPLLRRAVSLQRTRTAQLATSVYGS